MERLEWASVVHWACQQRLGQSSLRPVTRVASTRERVRKESIYTSNALGGNWSRWLWKRDGFTSSIRETFYIKIAMIILQPELHPNYSTLPKKSTRTGSVHFANKSAGRASFAMGLLS